MSTEAKTYKLSDRPTWRMPRLLARVARLLLVASVIAMIIGYVWGYFIYEATADIEGGEALIAMMGSNAGEMLMTLGFYALNIAFYAGMLWFVSLIVDKLDQLVWLNATDADRSEILQKRNKKNAKNQ